MEDMETDRMSGNIKVEKLHPEGPTPTHPTQNLIQSRLGDGSAPHPRRAGDGGGGAAAAR